MPPPDITTPNASPPDKMPDSPVRRALVYARVHDDDPRSIGVSKKVAAQANGLRSLGYDVDVFGLGQHGATLNGEPIDSTVAGLGVRSPATYRYLLRRFDRTIADAVQDQVARLGPYELSYLRYPFANAGFADLMDTLATATEKRVIDMPTYPYSMEFRGVRARLVGLFDARYRRRALRHVDLIGHYGPETTIFGKPTVRLANPIDCRSISLSSSHPTDDLRLIAVGNWHTWHGLDRVINALATEPKARLTVVGDGPEVASLRELAASVGVGERVAFVGPTFGAELDALFDNHDVGVGTLAIHRKGLTADSSLKHREYCARGLPFVLAANDPEFDDVAFVHRVPTTDQAIALGRVIDFYSLMSSDLAAHRQAMRAHAKHHLSAEAQMQRVLTALTTP